MHHIRHIGQIDKGLYIENIDIQIFGLVIIVLLMATGGLWKNIHVTITITINNFNNKKIHGNHKKLKNLLATYQL